MTTQKKLKIIIFRNYGPKIVKDLLKNIYITLFSFKSALYFNVKLVTFLHLKNEFRTYSFGTPVDKMKN